MEDTIMFIAIHINPAAAVRAGKSTSGPVRLAITDEMLATLTADQREELSRSGVDDATPTSMVGCAVGDPDIAAPEWAEVVAVLDARAAYRARQAEKAAAERESFRGRLETILRDRATRESRYNMQSGGRVHPCLRVEPNWPSPYSSHYYDSSMMDEMRNSPAARAWQAELDARNEQAASEAQALLAERAERAEEDKNKLAEEKAAAARLRDEACRAFIETHRPGMLERYEANVLPTDELWGAIRDHVFSPLSAHERYTRLIDSDLQHDCESNVDFEVEDADGLTAGQWAALKTLRAALPSATITPRKHVGSCDQCDSVVTRFSARAVAEWHGRELSREYALPDEQKTEEP
jgi:hypothetical protein